MDGLMKGIIKTGVIFSAVLVAALFVFYIIPAFAAGATLTIAAPTPANNSNVSTVGAQGYFYVNISLTNNSVSSPNLEVYNLSVAGSLFMNFTMTNSTGNNIFNYTFFNVTGLSNGTFTWRVVGINVSEGLGANQTFGNFTVTLGQIYKAVITNPASGTTTNDVTPELRVSANSTFLTNLSLTFYTTKAGVTQAIINTTILNGTETAFNLTTLSNGTYTITAELGNSADFKVNSTAITLTVRHLEASASVNVASVNAGAKQNYTFTITNNGTDDNTDSIDMVNISYSAAGYADPAAGDIVCPTTTNLWNRSVDPVVNSIVCLLPGPGDDKITAGVSKTIKVENWSATNTGGLKLFSTSVRGAIGAGTKTVADSASTSVYGNLSLTGTSRVAATKEIGSTNVTIISFNLSATGEQMNISSITVARTGTATDADIVSVALYNSTQENAQTFNETLNIDPLAVNTSAPTAGAYTFSGLSLVVPSSQILIVVFNVSSTATGGGVFGAGIVAASSVTTTGGASGQSITETLATHVSGNSTIYGTLAVAGTNRASATTIIGTNNVTLMSLNFSATGEAMSVSEIVLMLNGTSISSADIQSVSLYNSTLVDTTTYNGTQTRLATNTTVTETPTSLTYNFSGLGLSVAAGSTKQTILVVVNVSSSATAGHTINATILNNANIVTTSAASGQSIAETLATGSSSSTIVVGTLAVTGISQVASTTQIGTKNITVIKFNFTAAGE
ncbi:MAG: hypothetical protein J4400_03125, partial [Candidatus Aenigmarchaeota archaeon]|nr:hypothetical protein [Candidatus Aenigmarchaeota archaeon]